MSDACSANRTDSIRRFSREFRQGSRNPANCVDDSRWTPDARPPPSPAHRAPLRTLPVQELVHELRVKSLRATVLPRTRRRDMLQANLGQRQPVSRSSRNELRTIVAPDVHRTDMSHKQAGESLDHRCARGRVPRHQTQVFPRQLIHDAQLFKARSSFRPIEDEIPAPAMIPPLHAMSHSAILALAQATLLPLFPRHLSGILDATVDTPATYESLRSLRSIRQNNRPESSAAGLLLSCRHTWQKILAINVRRCRSDPRPSAYRPTFAFASASRFSQSLR